jgi:hypothetical protein
MPLVRVVEQAITGWPTPMASMPCFQACCRWLCKVSWECPSLGFSGFCADQLDEMATGNTIDRLTWLLEYLETSQGQRFDTPLNLTVHPIGYADTVHHLGVWRRFFDRGYIRHIHPSNRAALWNVHTTLGLKFDALRQALLQVQLRANPGKTQSVCDEPQLALAILDFT